MNQAIEQAERLADEQGLGAFLMQMPCRQTGHKSGLTEIVYTAVRDENLGGWREATPAERAALLILKAASEWHHSTN